MSNNNGKVVCVTGGSGFIASWIVKFLLQRGYTVRATVRDPSNPKKVDHLLKLDGAKERLQLFKAELMEEGSFDSAIEGCDGVFHTASPVLLGAVKDPQAELIDPAVKGTLNVLQSCAKSPSVRRVVVTSSMAAVLFCGRPLSPEVVVDETWFSHPDFCKESQFRVQLWYILSKTLAEDAAWKFVNKNNIDMVVIFPSMVGGPLLQPEVNESVQPILKLINGEPFPNASYGWLNVKDVADAHILAYENASASGRYCLTERVVHISEVARILGDLYPTLQVSDKCEDDNPYMPTYQISKDKAQSLGIEFIPLEVTIKETVESFREKKIKFRRRRNTMSNNNGKLVCVTGASGFIASWIVKFLLQRGYTVRATLRDPSNPKKVDHLLKLDGANERLHIYKADLLKEGSFESAVEGCDGVFHAASPVLFGVINDPQGELIDPAVKGTLNVLQSCAKSPSVKRVVLTSSMAAVVRNTRPKTPDVLVDETWFSDPDFCRDSKAWYMLSKTLAENAAWEFVKENKIDMVVMNPAMVIGPLLQPEVNTTSDSILSLINGSQTFPNATYGWVNVKDVANAHILAYEIASASGRYCLSERVIHFSEIVKILHHLYPTLQISDKCEDDGPYISTYQTSKEKAKSLGIEFTPFEVSLKETVESFREKKIVNF